MTKTTVPQSTNQLFCPKCRARDAYTRFAVLESRPGSWEARQALAAWQRAEHNAHQPEPTFTTEETR